VAYIVQRQSKQFTVVVYK